MITATDNLAEHDVTVPFGTWQRSNRASAIVFLVTLAPFAALAISRVGFRWFPVQDQAVLDLRLRDVLSGTDVPVVGAFSRFGWSHPGPVWFYVLAPFRWLGGPTGILVGSIFLFGAGIATTATLLLRRFGYWGAAVGIAGLWPAVIAAGSFAILVPWNPHLAFAWYPVFLVLCASAAFERPRDLAPALFIGGALVQLHVGFGVLTAIPFATSLGANALRDRSDLRNALRRGLRRKSLYAWTAATLALWTPPILEQLRNGEDGNLRRLFDFFTGERTQGGDPVGWGFAMRILGGVLRLPLNGLGGNGESTDPFNGYIEPGSKWTILIVVVLLGLTGVVLAVHRDGAGLRTFAVVVAALLAGAVALSRVVGERWPYLFVWRYVLVWFVVVGSILLLGRATTSGRTTAGGVERRGPAALALAIAVLGVSVLAVTWGDRRDDILPFERATASLAAQIERSQAPDGRVQIIRFDAMLEGVADGILNRLDEDGWTAGVKPDLAYKYGTHRSLSVAEADRVWFVTETSVGTTIAEALPEAKQVARTSPLDDGDDEELASLQIGLIDALRDQGKLSLLPTVGSPLVGFAMDRAGVDTSGIDIRRLAALNERVATASTCRCAVVAVPSNTTDDLAAAVSSLPDQG